MSEHSNFLDYLNSVVFDLIHFRKNNNINRQVIIRQILFTGYEALGITIFISLILGAVVIQMGYQYLGSLGQTNWIYKILVSIIVRDIGPVVTTFVILLRSGTAITTELGNMKVNREIHYLKSLGISPISYIVSPRILGMVFSIILLMMYFSFVGIMGGFIVSSFVNPLPFGEFLRRLSLEINLTDLALMVLKAGVSGFVIGAICSFHGLQVTAAVTEVPQRNIKAVSQGVLAVIVINTILIAGYLVY